MAYLTPQVLEVFVSFLNYMLSHYIIYIEQRKALTYVAWTPKMSLRSCWILQKYTIFGESGMHH